MVFVSERDAPIELSRRASAASTLRRSGGPEQLASATIGGTTGARHRDPIRPGLRIVFTQVLEPQYLESLISQGNSEFPLTMTGGA